MSYTVPPLVAIKEANVHLQALFERNIKLEKEVNDLHAVLALKDKREQSLLEQQELLKAEYEEKICKQRQTLNLQHEEKLREQQKIYELEIQSLLEKLSSPTEQIEVKDVESVDQDDEEIDRLPAVVQKDDGLAIVTLEEMGDKLAVDQTVESEKSEVVDEQEDVMKKTEVAVDAVVKLDQGEVFSEPETLLGNAEGEIDSVVTLEKADVTEQQTEFEKSECLAEKDVDLKKIETIDEEETLLKKIEDVVEEVVELVESEAVTEKETEVEIIGDKDEETVEKPVTLKDETNQEKTQKEMESAIKSITDVSVVGETPNELSVITEQPKASAQPNYVVDESTVYGASEVLKKEDDTEKIVENVEKGSIIIATTGEPSEEEALKRFEHVVKEKDDKILSLENEMARISTELKANETVISDLKKKGEILEEIMQYKNELRSIASCMEKAEEFEVSRNNDLNNNEKVFLDIETNV